MIARGGQRLLASAPRQRGAVLVMVVISLLALLAMTGLALDGSYNMLNKTRLQSVVDAAALSAAKTLNDNNGDTALALAEAMLMFNENSAEAGNGEIAQAVADGEVNVVVEFSNTLMPFDPGSVNPPAAPAEYVRVTATNMLLDTWLMPVVGKNQTVVEASAVSGPSVTTELTCDVAPMMVCAAPGSEEDAPFYGYQQNEVIVLKAGQPGEDMERGNFQLIRTYDRDGNLNSGGADIREAMAGNAEACVSSEAPLETEPGNTVGPSAQGLNTRMNIYTGPMQGMEATYPPDKYVHQAEGEFSYVENPKNSGNWEVHYDDGTTVHVQPDGATNLMDNGIIDYTHAQYSNAAAPGPGSVTPSPYAAEGRRILKIPVGACGDENGQSEVPYRTVLCFFLMQEVAQGPTPDIFGEFIGESCAGDGKPGPIPNNGPGPFVIQLYKDADRTES